MWKKCWKSIISVSYTHLNTTKGGNSGKVDNNNDGVIGDIGDDIEEGVDDIVGDGNDENTTDTTNNQNQTKNNNKTTTTKK